MQDPIADILRKQYGDDFHDVYHHAVTKQIRQQIGRELLERSEYHTDGGRIVWIDDIHKICLVEGE